MDNSQETTENERGSGRGSLAGRIFGDLIYFTPWFGDKKIVRDVNKPAISAAVITAKYAVYVGIPAFIIYRATQISEQMGADLGDTLHILQEFGTDATRLIS